MPVQQSDPLGCGLCWSAKVACSGKWITGREPREVLLQSSAWTYSTPEELVRLIKEESTEYLVSEVDIHVNESLQTITLSKNGKNGTARFTGPQGAIVVDSPEAQIQFEPMAIDCSGLKRLPDNLPVGGLYETETKKPDQTLVDRAVATMFANPQQMTCAYLVMHRGRIIAERYLPPFDRDTRFESWSMGKSIASTLIGRLMQLGRVDIEEDSLFEEWCRKNDPRRAIKLKHLLNMSSGLQFTGSFGRGGNTLEKTRDGLFHDHIYVYAAGIDAYRFCVEKRQELKPGTTVRYRNCDPLLTMKLIRERETDSLAKFLNLPQKLLFDPLGIGSFVLETDPYGGFLISGHDYACARDWAKLGQLWLQRGIWYGEQFLDPDYVKFALTPAPGSEEPYYGGFIILNRSQIAAGLPPDACWFSGGGLQRTFIVPSCKLVIVRLGHVFGSAYGLEASIQEANRLLVEAVG